MCAFRIAGPDRTVYDPLSAKAAAHRTPHAHHTSHTKQPLVLECLMAANGYQWRTQPQHNSHGISDLSAFQLDASC
jgi:hypothetical protein